MSNWLCKGLIIVKCPICGAKFPQQSIKLHVWGKHKIKYENK
jgi:hypothetical protein